MENENLEKTMDLEERHEEGLEGRLVLAGPEFSSCIDKVTKLLSEKLKQPVELNVEYDPSIIGGFVAEVGGRYYDASVAERLFRMKQYILG